MTKNSLKLGDKVKVYLSPNGNLSHAKTNYTLVGTIFAITRDGNEFMVGWNGSEETPSNALFRTGDSLSPRYNYVTNQKDYKIRVLLFVSWSKWEEFVSNECVPKKELKVEFDERSKEMKFFSGSLPRECICRIPKESCVYHR